MGDANAWFQTPLPIPGGCARAVGERGYILVSHRSWKTSRHPISSVRLDRPSYCRMSFADRCGMAVVVRPPCRSPVAVLRYGR